MHRRTLLVGLATTATAGCLGQGEGSSGDPTATSSPPSRGTWDDVGTEPGNRPPASDEFDGVACPDSRAADRTVCYHTNGRDSDVVLSTYPEVFDPDRGDDTVEALTFTLGNAGEWAVHVNPYDWAIHHRDGDSWTQVAPNAPIKEPLYVVEPGQTLEWELPEMTRPPPGGDDSFRVDTPLEPGVHAFSVTGQYGRAGPTDTSSGEPPAGTTAFVALFRLASPVGDAGKTATESTTPATE